MPRQRYRLIITPRNCGSRADSPYALSFFAALRMTVRMVTNKYRWRSLRVLRPGGARRQSQRRDQLLFAHPELRRSSGEVRAALAGVAQGGAQGFFADAQGGSRGSQVDVRALLPILPGLCAVLLLRLRAVLRPRADGFA